MRENFLFAHRVHETLCVLEKSLHRRNQYIKVYLANAVAVVEQNNIEKSNNNIEDMNCVLCVCAFKIYYSLLLAWIDREENSIASFVRVCVVAAFASSNVNIVLLRFVFFLHSFPSH